ncbi:4527_t:CDS:2, partial [Gigaspora rosea]
SFNFDTQYLLMLKSEINSASGDKSHCTIRINDFGICMLGTCALKAVENTVQIEAVSTNISNNVDNKSVCLFVYDLNDRNKSVNDPTVLQRLTLNTCTIDINYPYQLCNFGQIKVEWTQENNTEIYYSNEIKKENEILFDNKSYICVSSS